MKRGHDCPACGECEGFFTWRSATSVSWDKEQSYAWLDADRLSDAPACQHCGYEPSAEEIDEMFTKAWESTDADEIGLDSFKRSR